MDDDLLFHNKFVSDLHVSNTYDISNRVKEAEFRSHIDTKKNTVGLNDEDTDVYEEYVMTTNPLVIDAETKKINKKRHVVEKRYIYNINSRSRQVTKSEYVEREVVTGEYVKVVTNDDGNIVYEAIDIDELNEEYNALNNPDSVVNPYYMNGENMYFKSFLYRTPDEYIIDLPLIHTNVKSVRLLSTIIPCTITNINKNNNHVMIDILFGSEEDVDNSAIDVVFGTLIVKIPYGNYTVDQVCTFIVQQINDFYYNNYENNTGNSIYDNLLTSSFFSYYYSSITGELYFEISQPSQSSIENIVIQAPTFYEAIIPYAIPSSSTTYSDAYLPLTTYSDPEVFMKTIAATLNYEYSDYGNNSYEELFVILNVGSNYYLCNLVDSFNLDLASIPNITAALNIGSGGTSSTALVYFVNVTNGYNEFVTFNSSTIARTLYFTVASTPYSITMNPRLYLSFEILMNDVINAMNTAYLPENFEYLVQEHYIYNSVTKSYDIEERHYIRGVTEFTFNCSSMPDLSPHIFGAVYDANESSLQNALLMQPVTTPWVNYNPSCPTDIDFTFNGVQYYAYIPSVNYASYEALMTAIIDAMNLTCKLGYFAFDQETDGITTRYYIYASDDFSLNFSNMITLGSVLVYPPQTSDLSSTSTRIDVTSGVNSLFLSYNAYIPHYHEFYLNIRQRVPDAPYSDDPMITNTSIKVVIPDATYLTINSLMTAIVYEINTLLTGAPFLISGITLSFSYTISNTQIVLSCTSTPANNVYEFSVNGTLMVELAYFLGIPSTASSSYASSYTFPYSYGNRLRFKMSFENNPLVEETDQLWFMLGYRANSSLNYVENKFTNIYNYGNDSYHFSSTSFINNFVPSQSTETVPNTEDNRPYRMPLMTKTNYVYLQLNSYENLYDPSIPNEKIFTKILLSQDYGNYAYDTFVDNPYILNTTDSKLDRFHIKFIDKNGNAVDFNNIEHVLTLEIVEFSDRLSVNDYNTRRGYTEHESYPRALEMSYGK